MSLRDNYRARRRGGFRSSRMGYTLTEMIVVAGIVVFVAGISIPLMAPFLRGGAVREASDMVKMACVTARSFAVQQNERQDLLLIAEEGEHSIQVLSAPRLADPASATGAGASSISTGANLGDANKWEDFFVTVRDGRGKGQTRGIAGNTANTLTLKAAWETNPIAGSVFQIYKNVERKIVLPENTFFDFDGVRVYTFTPMGTISTDAPLTFSIEDVTERQARADIAGGANEADVRRGNWRDFRLYTTTGMVNSEQRER